MSGNNFKLVVRPNNNGNGNSIDGLRTLTNITEQPYMDSSGNIDMSGNYLLVKNIEAGNTRFTTGGDVGIIHTFSDSSNVGVYSINVKNARNNIGGNNRRYCSFQPQTSGFIAGSITGNPGQVSYNTTSDERLKEVFHQNEVVPANKRLAEDYIGQYTSHYVADDGSLIDHTSTSWLGSVKELTPIIYRFNSASGVDSSFNYDISLNNAIEYRSVDYQGFFAEDVRRVYPPAVTGRSNQTDVNGDPVYQQLDMSKLIPMLVGAIKELSDTIDALTVRVEANEEKLAKIRV